VLVSDASALPETVGDAGELFTPGDPGLLARSIATLIARPERLADLRARGLARAGGFTWDRTAAQTLAVYRDAAGR